MTPWDYLILTAAHEVQAAAYREELALRESLGLLTGFDRSLVVPDPGGARVGSGGSTVRCLLEVLRRELPGSAQGAGDRRCWLDALQHKRILIIHAGGDSRRLPAYGPCGKVFVPLPGANDSALGLTLLDRQLPVYRRLSAPEREAGQVAIASGDVLLEFSAQEVRLAPQGVTGLGCYASPLQASGHGVYCCGAGGRIRRFLQKPTPEQQAEAGAIDAAGRSVLDVGVLSFDAEFAVRLLDLAGARADGAGGLDWSGPVGEAIQTLGLDFYREVCCALGEEASIKDYRRSVRGAGSRWPDRLLDRVFECVAATPCRMHLLKRCGFLHFGTTRQIIASGQELVKREDHFAPAHAFVSVNNRQREGAWVSAAHGWIEGCTVSGRLTLAGENVVVGAEIDSPLELGPGACLDLLPGRTPDGTPVTFVRSYRVDEPMQTGAGPALALGGLPLGEWLDAAGMDAAEIWDEALPEDERTLFRARLFPAVGRPGDFRRWLWMLDPAGAAPAQWAAWRRDARYSLEEMARLADLDAFRGRRRDLRADEVRRGLARLFSADSGFSAADLGLLLRGAARPADWAAAVLTEARRQGEDRNEASAEEAFLPARVLHSLGTALASLDQAGGQQGAGPGPEIEASLAESLAPGAAPEAGASPARRSWGEIGEMARAAAFRTLRETIVASGGRAGAALASALRTDEIVWGRAPARLDLAGGWTDTPPFSLERGGCVVNAAVDLNGQPPIQVYARVTPEPRIRLHSIDVGSDLVIARWEDLLDYGSVTSEFSLVKAAVSISGFSPAAHPAGAGRSLEDALRRFGGGLEITTLAAIPKGSGLGTSSIMGAVLLAVVHRALGRALSPTDLFHAVLRLEQELTTGGGWQDQIGGSVGGLKLITTEPGMVPEAAIRYLPAEVLAPSANGGLTLLYYTGITRLAKNILQEVVARYLDRDRRAVATLEGLGALARELADALARKDLPRAGRLIDRAWGLNKQLDPNSTNEEIEVLLARVRRHVHGAKLLGAGGGGFLLMVCKSAADAAKVREMLEAEPPNPRARFFGFDVSPRGLEVSVC